MIQRMVPVVATHPPIETAVVSTLCSNPATIIVSSTCTLVSTTK